MKFNQGASIFVLIRIADSRPSAKKSLKKYFDVDVVSPVVYIPMVLFAFDYVYGRRCNYASPS